MPEPPTLRSVVRALRRCYGAPAPPVTADPFQLILWEQVAYLVPDDRRQRAFDALRGRVGLSPQAILAAPESALHAVTRLGGSIAAPERAGRIRRSAELVLRRWDGELRGALALPLPQARRALAAFPMIGEPGADRILACAGHTQLLPLDSNALRVVQRLGLVAQARDYRTSYRRAREALAPELPKQRGWGVAASALLRRHGQELCRRSAPLCRQCPLAEPCPSAEPSIG